MSNRYIAWESIRKRATPRCDLPGSPFTSRIAAKGAAEKEKIALAKVTIVKRKKA